MSAMQGCDTRDGVLGVAWMRLPGFVLAVLCIPQPIVEHVDIVERNYVHEESGRQRLDQVIFWSVDSRGPYVRDYRITRDLPRSVQLRPNPLRWTEDGRRIEVWWGLWHETHTLNDPELDDREHLPISKRRRIGQ